MTGVKRGQASFAFDSATVPIESPGSLTAWTPELWEVAPDWKPLVNRFFADPIAAKLGDFVQGRLAAGGDCFPPSASSRFGFDAAVRGESGDSGAGPLPWRGPSARVGLFGIFWRCAPPVIEKYL